MSIKLIEQWPPDFVVPFDSTQPVVERPEQIAVAKQFSRIFDRISAEYSADITRQDNDADYKVVANGIDARLKLETNKDTKKFNGSRRLQIEPLVDTPITSPVPYVQYYLDVHGVVRRMDNAQHARNAVSDFVLVNGEEPFEPYVGSITQLIEDPKGYSEFVRQQELNDAFSTEMGFLRCPVSAKEIGGLALYLEQQEL